MSSHNLFYLISTSRLSSQLRGQGDTDNYSPIVFIIQSKIYIEMIIKNNKMLNFWKVGLGVGTVFVIVDHDFPSPG